jgi:hypothetical protein
LAAQAGWPKSSIKKLGQIILRESGGCPSRVGGDVVDKDCNFLRVAEHTPFGQWVTADQWRPLEARPCPIRRPSLQEDGCV